MQKEDAKISQIIIKFQLKNDEKLMKNYCMKGNLLFKNTLNGKKLVITEDLAKKLALELHEIYGHIGFKKPTK